MPERATKTIHTPGTDNDSGHTIVMYNYITGGEHLRLQDVFLSRMEVSRFSGSQEKPEADVKGLTGSVAVESVKLAIEMLVVSVDGKTENVVSSVLALPLADYEAVKEALDEVADGGKKNN
jgi:hypothetical protein